MAKNKKESNAESAFVAWVGTIRRQKVNEGRKGCSLPAIKMPAKVKTVVGRRDKTYDYVRDLGFELILLLLI